MSLTLTAAGKVAPPPPKILTKDPYAEWKRVVQRLLALAVETKPVRERLEQMKTWLDDNPFHDRYNERFEQHHCELMDSYVAEGKLYDLSAEACYWQMQMSDEQIASLEAWLGVQLMPMIAQKWAKVAQWIGRSDIRVVATFEQIEVPF